MNNYFCSECGYEGDEPICPHCNIPAESLDVSEDDLAKQATYPQETLEKVEREEETFGEEIGGDQKIPLEEMEEEI